MKLEKYLLLCQKIHDATKVHFDAIGVHLGWVRCKFWCICCYSDFAYDHRKNGFFPFSVTGVEISNLKNRKFIDWESENRRNLARVLRTAGSTSLQFKSCRSKKKRVVMHIRLSANCKNHKNPENGQNHFIFEICI